MSDKKQFRIINKGKGKLETIPADIYKVGVGSGGFPTESFEAVLSTDKTLGKYVNGDIVPSYANATDMLNDLGREVILPTFNLPIAYISGNPGVPSSKEVGEEMTVLFTATLNSRDGGGPTNYRITENSVDVLDSPTVNTVSRTFLLTEASRVFQSIVSYAEGTEPKDDSLGNSIPNPIEAGSDPSSTLSYRGYRRVFYGNVATPVSTASDVRTLTSFINKTSGTSTFILNTGTTNIIFQFWLDESLSLESVIDLDASNLPIADYYEETNLAVYDASLATTIPGKLYTMTILGPYEPSHRHQVTFRN